MDPRRQSIVNANSFIMKNAGRILVFFAIAAMGSLCGCGPTQDDIVTPQAIRKIEQQYKEETGDDTKFVKVHEFANPCLWAVIERNGKRYLAQCIIIRIVDGKPVVTINPMADQPL